MTTDQWKSALARYASPEKAKILSRFFKTGKGEYGEGDRFIGVTVPCIRAVAADYITAPLELIEQMLGSKIHEHRMSALLALVGQYKKTKSNELRQTIVNFYLSHTASINNWDLVDLTAPKIIGEWLTCHPDPAMLDKLSVSPLMWERRIAIVATLTLIRKGHFTDTLRLAERYLDETEPLMHKATGWMLRETGKRDENTLLQFLDRHASRMPRTALRYAIERLSPELRKKYMAVKRVNAH